MEMQTTPPAIFPFESRFVSVDGHRIHYVEQGQGDPVLFVHGQPTWSYLWRNVLPTVVADTGRRGIALDLLGFGKSDKPEVNYTLELHYRVMQGFIEQLNLRNLVLVLHDWGGPIGAYYAVHHPENVQAVAFMETFVAPMQWADLGRYKVPFKLFRSPAGYLLFQVLNMFVNQLMPAFVLNKQNLTKETMRRYREPFPTSKSRKAVAQFPKLLPIGGKPRESYEFLKTIENRLPTTKFPVLLVKATPGGVVNSEGKVQRFREAIPQLQVKEFGPGIHYLQEEDPAKLSSIVVEWIRDSRLGRAKSPITTNEQEKGGIDEGS